MSTTENDILLVSTAANATIRCLVATTRSIVQEASQRQETTPTATAALGRALTSGVIMSHMLGEGERLTLQWIGNGPIGKVVVVAESKGAVRGYVSNPYVDVPLKSPGKLDVGRAVGTDGFLYITKDMGLGKPYTGSVPLVSGEIAEDLARYFLESEQTPSVVSLGVLVGTDKSVVAAGGFLIQALPGIADDTISQLEKTVGELPSMTNMLTSGMSIFDISERLLTGFDHHVIDEHEILWECTCSRERLESVLLSLGEEDLNHIVSTDDDIKVTCDFCRKHYEFTHDDIMLLIESIKEPNS